MRKKTPIVPAFKPVFRARLTTPVQNDQQDIISQGDGVGLRSFYEVINYRDQVNRFGYMK
jgi:hypothetical protein